MSHPTDLLFGQKERKEKWKDIRVRVPRPLYDRFKEALPMHGAASWFLMRSMELFLDTYTDYPGDALVRSVEALSKALTEGKKAVILNTISDTTSGEGLPYDPETGHPIGTLKRDPKLG